jgi:hypothetical protein
LCELGFQRILDFKNENLKNQNMSKSNNFSIVLKKFNETYKIMGIHVAKCKVFPNNYEDLKVKKG